MKTDESLREHIICCPIFDALSILEKKWALAILKEIYKGTSKFNDLKRKLKGINPSILSRRLAELEKKQLVSRRVKSGRPVVVEYALTEKAKNLFACWPKTKA
jgi:DNA-binding HxlR family transcriptional regulator